MTFEQERWAEALAVHQKHEDDAADFIAERVRELAMQGDEAGVERWLSIAVRVDRLTRSLSLH